MTGIVTRIVIADDHAIFRQGLVRLLSSLETATVLGEAGDGDSAFGLISDLKPDIAVVDISMPGCDGIELAERVRRAGFHTKILLLTMHGDPALAGRAIEAGAAGYILKDDAFEDLVHAIRTVLSGNRFISSSIAERMLVLPARESQPLSAREKEVLKLIANGKTNRDISEILFISVKTVDTHRTRIMEKLDRHTIADLVRYAVKSGLV